MGMEDSQSFCFFSMSTSQPDGNLPLYGLVPDHPFIEDYMSCQMVILSKNFFLKADEGQIRLKKSAKWWVWELGVVLDDGTRLEADVVPLATGFDGKKRLRSVPSNDY